MPPDSAICGLYNPGMHISWKTIALGSLLLGLVTTQAGQPAPAPTRGRILGIGGVFFKAADQKQTREWYATHLGIADKGGGAMLPWRERDDPSKEHVTSWTVFPASATYFPGPFMINYIVDDMDALLERLAKEGVKIDPKRQDASFGRFAWIYDGDGNKIELWQPIGK